MMKPALILVAHTLLFATASQGSAAEPADRAFATTVAPVLKTYCFGCHSGAKPKGDLALDKLTADFAANGDAWANVLKRLAEESMPPEGKPRPTAAERKAVASWGTAGLIAHQAKKAAAEGRTRLRRLNRVEYVNTLRDLFGAEIDIETLPEDGIASGFDNIDAALDLSPTLLERYLESADAALDAVFVKGSKPRATKQHLSLVPLAKELTKTNRPMPRYGYSTVIREDEVIFLGENEASKPLREATTAGAGLYRIRISANAIRHGKGMTLLFYAGDFSRGQQALTTRSLGAHDVTDKPAVLEFTERMGSRETIRIYPHGLPNVYAKVADNYSGPGLAVQWIEVEGPFVDVWPPTAATRMLGDVDPVKGTLADAGTILRRFAPRAFRRPVADVELAPYVAVVKSRLDKGYTFEAALRVGLKAVLCSPDFLYLSPSPPTEGERAG